MDNSIDNLSNKSLNLIAGMASPMNLFENIPQTKGTVRRQIPVNRTQSSINADYERWDDGRLIISMHSGQTLVPSINQRYRLGWFKEDEGDNYVLYTPYVGVVSDVVATGEVGLGMPEKPTELIHKSDPYCFICKDVLDLYEYVGVMLQGNWKVLPLRQVMNTCRESINIAFYTVECREEVLPAPNQRVIPTLVAKDGMFTFGPTALIVDFN